MFLQDLTVNKNIIQICLTEFMQTFEQYIVDIMLKERRFIDQFKKHYSILVNVEKVTKVVKFLLSELIRSLLNAAIMLS